MTVGALGLTLCQSSAFASPPNVELLKLSSVASIPRPNRLPPGSFLKEPVQNIDELQLQLLKRSDVSNRYARTINMTPRMIRLAFSKLHLTTLQGDQALEVYYCHPTAKGEVIGYKKRKFKSGTKVFALADGTPAMIQICGNPTRQLKTLANSISRDPGKFSTGHPADPSLIPDWDPSEPVLARANPEIALDNRPIITTNDFEEVPNALLNIPEEPNLPISRLAPYSEQTLGEWVRGIPRGSFNFLGPALGIAGGLTGIGLSINGGRTPGSTGSIPSLPGIDPIIPGNQNPLGPSIVPEPGFVGFASSLLVFSFGFLWMTARRKAKASKA